MPKITFDISTLVLIINILTFFVYGIDKLKAKRKTFRVPEALLLMLALLFGGTGAILGMVVFNHKTSKLAFRIIVPLSFALNYIFSYDSFSLFKSCLTCILQIIPE